MTPFVTAGVGFLLAVLWFDLMHDVQVVGQHESTLPDETLDSISRYYRRVTTEARPMNRLVAAAMLATLGSLVAQIATADAPAWAAWSSLVLLASAIGLAGVRTVPHAVRLGGRIDDAVHQSRLARGIGRDHLYCLIAASATLVIQLAFARH